MIATTPAPAVPVGADPDGLTDAIRNRLAELHPDPFVQAAMWRLFKGAPDLLADQVLDAVGNAHPVTSLRVR